MPIDRFKCSHVFNAYGDIMYTFVGAIGALLSDLSKRSKLFNVPGGIIYTVPGAAAMSFDLSQRSHGSNAYGDVL